MNSSEICSISDYRDKKGGLSKSHGIVQKVVKDQKMDDLLKTYIEKVDKDQMALREEMREREQRTEKRIDDSEHRMEAKISRIEEMINSQNEKMDTLKETINVKMEEEKKYRHSNTIAIISGVVATVLAMVGIYYATISTITSIMGLVK
jgi:exonuclease VII large subunit